jgi:hypothetical protein
VEVRFANLVEEALPQKLHQAPQAPPPNREAISTKARSALHQKTRNSYRTKKTNPGLRLSAKARDRLLSSFKLVLPAASAAASTSTAAEVVTSSAAAVFSRFCFFDYDGTAIQLRFVEFTNGSHGFAIVIHFDKAEAFRAARELVLDYIGGRNRTKSLEGFSQILASSVEAEFCNKNVHYKKIKRKESCSAGTAGGINIELNGEILQTCERREIKLTRQQEE